MDTTYVTSNLLQSNTKMATDMNDLPEESKQATQARTEVDTSPMSDEDTASTQSSITFSKYPCFICPGTVPIET